MFMLSFGPLFFRSPQEDQPDDPRMISLMISIALGILVPLKPTLQLLNLAVACRSNMPNIMDPPTKMTAQYPTIRGYISIGSIVLDPVLPMLSVLGYWAIMLGRSEASP